MAAFAAHGNLKLVRRRHLRSGAHRELPNRDSGHVMHAIDFLDAPTVHQPGVDHRARTAASFFGGLEGQHNSTVKIPRLGQVFRRPQEHRRVPVMTAGMHFSRHGR